MFEYGTNYTTIIAAWIAGAVVVAIIASSRGKAPGGFLILSLLLSPLLGLILVLAQPSGNRGPCWRCKEQVIVGAQVCPRCSAALAWDGNQARDPAAATPE